MELPKFTRCFSKLTSKLPGNASYAMVAPSQYQQSILPRLARKEESELDCMGMYQDGTLVEQLTIARMVIVIL